AISKMSFGNDIGAVINDDDLYDTHYGSFILEVDGDPNALFDGYDFKVIGKTADSGNITANGTEISIEKAKEAWFKPLEKVFPTNYYKPFEKKDISVKPFNIIEKRTSSLSLAAPRVLMPVFPGTNCEYDTLRAFERAGADAKTLVISNLKNSWLEESIDKMAEMIRNSQIIMIPGGFSAGDEPEGSGKFIAAVFRNPKIKEAVTDLLQNRDGLMLGICNGFQALIKLGLVPYGEIRDMEDDSPTLTFNTIGRHISCMANTKIISNKSPWLWGTNAGDIHTVAFSHGEGRFAASEEVIKKLAENNQIATQYVDFSGEPTYDIKYNPNGSVYAIEGITSPDGRVLGKMGHSERLSSGTFKNIVGTTDQWIYKSGVNYYK
ncbi:MAG: phosphoribosylformylglycinamidine synthase subunit PurQ, partial [Firmicutes bacterium]|nr:phosphoribosylformylglycinamidine synthase subunit PurQ [Bacillota bacterium]